MTYAYLEKLNRKSLLETTSSSLGVYNYVSSNSARMGTDEMSMAERVQFYQRLRSLDAKGQVPEEFKNSVVILDRAFSQMEVTMESATDNGEPVYLLDMNGNRVTMKHLIDSPDANYKWECEGGDLNATNYLKSETVATKKPAGKDSAQLVDSTREAYVAKEGVTQNTSSGCSGTTQTFEASGKTILGNLLTEKGGNVSALFRQDYSANLFR